MNSSQPPDAPELPPRVLAAIAGMGALGWMFAMLFVQGIAFALIVEFSPQSNDDPLLLGALPLGCAIVACFAMLRVHAPDAALKPFLGLTRQPLALLALAAVIGAALTPALTKYSAWLHAAMPRTAMEIAKLDQLFALDAVPSRFAVLLTVGILYPLSQELMFRGLLFERLRARMNPVSALAFSAMLAVIPHTDSLLALASTLPTLIVICVLRLATRSLWGPLAFQLGLGLAMYAPILRWPGYDPPSSMPFAVGGIAIACLALGLLRAFSARLAPWAPTEPVVVAKRA